MTAAAVPQQKGAMARLLDFIEVAGNKVPHPVLMFLYLIIGVIILSTVLGYLGVSVTEEIVVPDDVSKKSLKTLDAPIDADPEWLGAP